MTASRRYLRHLTLTTGHQRDSYRDEVSDDVVAMLRPLLARAVAGETVPLPAGDPPCSITARAGRARALRVVVWGPAPRPHSCEIAEVYVAPSSLAGAHLWRELRGSSMDDMRPSHPWVAVELCSGLLRYPHATDWLGDFERCLAWAWIDRAPTASA